MILSETLIKKPVHTAAVEFPTVPADKHILRLGVPFFQILPDCMNDLVIDEHDPLLIPFPNYQKLSCLQIHVPKTDT